MTASAVAMVSSFLVFFLVSWLTRRTAQAAIDPDVRLVMELYRWITPWRIRLALSELPLRARS